MSNNGTENEDKPPEQEPTSSPQITTNDFTKEDKVSATNTPRSMTPPTNEPIKNGKETVENPSNDNTQQRHTRSSSNHRRSRRKKHHRRHKYNSRSLSKSYSRSRSRSHSRSRSRSSTNSRSPSHSYSPTTHTRNKRAKSDKRSQLSIHNPNTHNSRPKPQRQEQGQAQGQGQGQRQRQRVEPQNRSSYAHALKGSTGRTFNIFVKNLPRTCQKQDLSGLFSRFGEIYSCAVIKRKQNLTKCFGFVNFATEEGQMNAVSASGKIHMNDSQIECEISSNVTVIYIGNLPLNVTVADVRYHVRFHGGPYRSLHIRNGHCFVVYDSYYGAERAIHKLQNTVIQSMKIWVAIASETKAKMLSTAQESPSQRSLFIGNLSPSVSESELRQRFERFGVLTSVRVPRVRGGANKRGFAFVEYESSGDCELAIRDQNQQMIHGQKMDIDWCRDERGQKNNGMQRVGQSMAHSNNVRAMHGFVHSLDHKTLQSLPVMEVEPGKFVKVIPASFMSGNSQNIPHIPMRTVNVNNNNNEQRRHRNERMGMGMAMGNNNNNRRVKVSHSHSHSESRSRSRSRNRHRSKRHRNRHSRDKKHHRHRHRSRHSKKRNRHKRHRSEGSDSESVSSKNSMSSERSDIKREKRRSNSNENGTDNGSKTVKRENGGTTTTTVIGNKSEDIGKK